MARYIDADKIPSKLFSVAVTDNFYGMEISQGIDIALNIINETPTADVVEVKHGFWKRNNPNPEQMKEFHDMGIGRAMAKNSIFWTCSCCGTWGTPRYKYCMECGAKMDGKDVNVTTARGNENGNK